MSKTKEEQVNEVIMDGIKKTVNISGNKTKSYQEAQGLCQEINEGELAERKALLTDEVKIKSLTAEVMDLRKKYARESIEVRKLNNTIDKLLYQKTTQDAIIKEAALKMVMVAGLELKPEPLSNEEELLLSDFDVSLGLGKL